MKHSKHPWTRRLYRSSLLGLLTLLLIPCIAGLALWAIYADPKYLRLLILMVLANVVTFVQIYQFRRVRNLVLSHHGKVCGNCLFPLEGLEDEGPCPECGHSYDIEQTVLDWKHDLHLVQLDADAARETDSPAASEGAVGVSTQT